MILEFCVETAINAITWMIILTIVVLVIWLISPRLQYPQKQ